MASHVLVDEFVMQVCNPYPCRFESSQICSLSACSCVSLFLFLEFRAIYDDFKFFTFG